jgi:SAM-dependent methyltransferase
MMFGTREQFLYSECFNCGCLQIDEPPIDASEHYPSNYYSLNRSPEFWMKRIVRKHRNRIAVNGSGPLTIVNSMIGRPEFVAWTESAELPIGAAILDVGAGAGELVSQMTDAGFTRVTGIDPNILKDIHLANGAVVRRATLSQVSDSYDFVMANHSFEHMEDQRRQLDQMYRVLNGGGLALIRMPVVGTFAWRAYGHNWVQLDAPRHLSLHTEKSMEILATSAGFSVEKVVFDSTAFQFWGSDLYKNDIALIESVTLTRPRPPVPRNLLNQMKRQAATLNAERQGDQAAFYLRKV